MCICICHLDVPVLAWLVLSFLFFPCFQWWRLTHHLQRAGFWQSHLNDSWMLQLMTLTSWLSLSYFPRECSLLLTRIATPNWFSDPADLLKLTSTWRYASLERPERLQGDMVFVTNWPVTGLRSTEHGRISDTDVGFWQWQWLYGTPEGSTCVTYCNLTASFCDHNYLFTFVHQTSKYRLFCRPSVYAFITVWLGDKVGRCSSSINWGRKPPTS